MILFKAHCNTLLRREIKTTQHMVSGQSFVRSALSDVRLGMGTTFWRSMNSNVKINNKFHMGVYGILLKDASILLVKKARGPYTGKLDLPGGKPEHGETPEQTLEREIIEETGVEAHASKLFDNYSTVAEQHMDDNTQDRIHHLGMIYMVLAYDDKALIQDMEAEDSLGAQWYCMANLTATMLSPFAHKVINDLGNAPKK